MSFLGSDWLLSDCHTIGNPYSISVFLWHDRRSPTLSGCRHGINIRSTAMDSPEEWAISREEMLTGLPPMLPCFIPFGFILPASCISRFFQDDLCPLRVSLFSGSNLHSIFIGRSSDIDDFPARIPSEVSLGI